MWYFAPFNKTDVRINCLLDSPFSVTNKRLKKLDQEATILMTMNTTLKAFDHHLSTQA